MKAKTHATINNLLLEMERTLRVISEETELPYPIGSGNRDTQIKRDELGIIEDIIKKAISQITRFNKENLLQKD